MCQTRNQHGTIRLQSKQAIETLCNFDCIDVLMTGHRSAYALIQNWIILLVITSKYIVLSVLLCVRGNVMLHEANNRFVYLHPPPRLPQYSAPGRAYDFRGKNASKCWQMHDMVNLIASWQSNYYQTTHQIARYISIWNPFFGCLNPPIKAKTCKKKIHNHYVCICYHMRHFSRC